MRVIADDSPPVLDGPGPDRVRVAAAFLLGVLARDTFCDPDAAERALQHALNLAEPDQVLDWLLRYPPPGPPTHHHRLPATAGTLIGQIAHLPADADRPTAPPNASAPHIRAQAITRGESRVLQYLPTHLSTGEIARQLYVSVNTVKTHQRHLYEKLGACSRTQAVGVARALGLLAP